VDGDGERDAVAGADLAVDAEADAALGVERRPRLKPAVAALLG
jgi:hypothetical protein